MKSLRPIASSPRGSPLGDHCKHRPLVYSAGLVLGKTPRPCFALRVTTNAGARPEATSESSSSACASLRFLVDNIILRRPVITPETAEDRIERVIYNCRFMAFLGVFGSLLGSILCFLKGCGHVISSFTEYSASGGKVIPTLVQAIDVYLIGTVMLVFGMGLYELFITNFDIVKQSSNGSNLLGMFKLPERPKCLEIKSVNELKTKVGHVIVMVLLVGLFEKSKKVTICTPRDLLCFTASILLSSCGLYLLSKLHNVKG